MKRNFVSGIIEDTLAKKPYGKHFAGLLFDGLVPASFDQVKLATECLKNLTSEDFMQLAQAESDRMVVYERKFKNTVGNSLENELSKIILRYQTEGKQVVSADNGKNKKKVRINEEPRQYGGEEEYQNQI